jgi:ADP-heptose:LPS heptosyltransferase
MNIIFQINGGIGKCVIATAVCEAIKKQYPESKLIVVSGYSDVFLNNPNVHRSYNFGSLNYFYEEFIEGKDIKLFAHDPYQTSEHIQYKEHVIETWCRLCDVPYNGELPKIYLTERERTFYKNKFLTEKPIFLIQPNGGVENAIKYSWARDIPFKITQKIINEFKGRYNILHIKRDDQISYENVIPVSDSFRAIAVLISISEKRLFMDSFAQHTAAAMSIPSTVLWVANRPNVFGYDIHNNIQSNPFTVKPELKNSFINKFNINGDLLEFPYNSEDEIFNYRDVIESILKH